jgi:hypothetical protein
MSASSQKSQSNINLSYMIEQIFSEEPQIPHFYHLDLETRSESTESESETETGSASASRSGSASTSAASSEASARVKSQNTANVLMTLFFNGCKKLYGENFGINNITKEQFEHANKYIQSFGYNTRYEYEFNESGVPVSLQVWFEKLN